MAIVEVDENELVTLRRINGVANKIMQDPEGRKLLEQAHKRVEPNAQTPTLDLEARIVAATEASAKRVVELEAKLVAEAAEREKTTKLADLQRGIDEGFASLRSQGWQEDGIKKVDELMKEKGIIDPLIAAAYVEKTMPPQQPATPSGGTSWNFMDAVGDTDADMKSLIANRGEGQTVDKMAADALREFRGSNQRR